MLISLWIWDDAVHLPAGMPHYAWAEVESVVQINGVGPFDVKYLNPNDDPRKQQ